MSAGDTHQGRRTDATEPGAVPTIEPWTYGKTTDGEWWVNVPPVGSGSISGHDVTEHEDGTITVSPSILASTRRWNRVAESWAELQWHGYLERGVFREV